VREREGEREREREREREMDEKALWPRPKRMANWILCSN
jgi:hypothetical protein